MLHDVADWCIAATFEILTPPLNIIEAQMFWGREYKRSERYIFNDN